MFSLRSLLITLFAVLGNPSVSPAVAQTPVTASVTGVIERAGHSVVLIRSFDRQGQPLAFGSGFVALDGRVVTNAHVVAGASSVEVVAWDGRVLLATRSVEALSVANDVAVLPKVPVPGFGLGLSSTPISVGERVVVIGAPEGLSNTVSDGIVSALRNFDGRTLLQLTAPISHGSSGGPVLNMRSQVIGIAAASLTLGQNLNFAVQADDIRRLLNVEPRQLSFPVADEKKVASVPDAKAAATPPPRVNDSLSIEWRSLDGVHVKQSSSDGKGNSVTTLARYAVAPNPRGQITVERVVTSIAHYRGAGHNLDVTQDDLRTLFTVGDINDFETTFSKAVLSTEAFTVGARPASSRTYVRGNSFTHETTGEMPVHGEVPNGVLPVEFGSIATSAWRGALPERVSLWLMEPNSGRPQLSRTELIGRTIMRVPFAIDATGCTGPLPRTVVREVRVLTTMRTIGVERREVALLESEPHVGVAVGDALLCVYIPPSPSMGSATETARASSKVASELAGFPVKATGTVGSFEVGFSGCRLELQTQVNAPQPISCVLRVRNTQQTGSSNFLILSGDLQEGNGDASTAQSYYLPADAEGHQMDELTGPRSVGIAVTAGTETLVEVLFRELPSGMKRNAHLTLGVKAAGFSLPHVLSFGDAIVRQ